MQTGCSIRFQRQVEEVRNFRTSHIPAFDHKSLALYNAVLRSAAGFGSFLPYGTENSCAVLACCTLLHCLRLPSATLFPCKRNHDIEQEQSCSTTPFFRDAEREGSGVLTYLRAALRGWIEGLLETIHKNQNLLSHRINRTGVPIESLAQLR